MKPLTKNTIERFLKIAMSKLKGKWVLIGGALLPILGISKRTTIDIDIVGPKDLGVTGQLELLKIAQELDLPIEAINQAANFFLWKIKDWDKMITPLYESKKITIFRPTVTLFLLLKINRLTEIDLSDCLDFIRYADEHNEPLDKKRVLTAIQNALREDPLKEKLERLQILQRRIKEL